MDSSVSGKDEIWFLRVCHHVPHELYHFRVYLYCVVFKCSRINSTKPPASGAGNVSEPRLMSQAGKVCKVVRVDQCVPVVRAVKVLLFMYLRSSCYHVTEVGGP